MAVQAAVARSRREARERAESRTRQRQREQEAAKQEEDAEIERERQIGLRHSLREAVLAGKDEGAAQLALELWVEMLCAQDDDGSNALHVAAASGAMKCAEAILRRKKIDAALTGRDRFGRTPLHCAAAVDSDGKLVQALVAHPACDVSVVDSEGQTALDIAREWGLSEAAKTLQKAAEKKAQRAAAAAAETAAAKTAAARGTSRDAELCADSDDTDHLAALRACSQSRPEEAIDIVNNLMWPFVNEIDERGRTVLHHAATRGWDGLCTAILSREDFALADAFTREERASALHLAAAARRADCCRAIVDSGCFFAINEPDQSGRTALHLAALRADADCYAAISAHEDCNPAIPDLTGKAAFEYAAERGLSVEVPEFAVGDIEF